MDCKTVRLLLDYARPRSAELAGDDAAALEGHLHACPDCEVLARGERQFDDHLGRAVRNVPVPDGLRDRLLNRLAAERRTWYRRQARRWGPVAAAAVVLLALGLWWQWPRHQLPAPDLDAMVEYVSQNNNARISAEKVEEWFNNNYPDLPVVAPREFELRALNYGLLAYADLGQFQGQRVPMLLFASGDKQARVYILSHKHFDLGELFRTQPVVDSKGYTVAVKPGPEGSGTVHVFIYTGNSMTPFLTGQAPGIF
jgi:hypothetical protein